MRRTVLSEKKDFRLNSARVHRMRKMQETEKKPFGLWYGFDNSWLDWVRGRYDYWQLSWLHTIEMDDSNVLRIENGIEIEAFTDEYSEGGLAAGPRKTRDIDWKKVSKTYSGIEIVPFLNDCNTRVELFWYYGWDVACGCIWDPSVFKRISQTRHPTEAMVDELIGE